MNNYKELPAIFFVIVLYNKKCFESESFRFAVDHINQANYIVVDNSTVITNNSSVCKEYGIDYISMCGNKGLACAYNAALEKINRSDGFVVWSDDDTLYPDSFFENLFNVINNSNGEVFLPLVKDNRGLFSPCIFDENYLPKRVNSCSDFEGTRVSGINSGMIVDLEIYNSFRYDENMFLDFIDHDFCYYCNANDISISLLYNCTIYQNAFFSSDFSFNRLRNRRKIFNKDFCYYCKKHRIKRSVMIRVLLHRDINTIKRYIANSLKKKG